MPARTVLIPPDRPAPTADWPALIAQDWPTLDELPIEFLQQSVGGHFEMIPLGELHGDNVVMVVNEDGDRLGLCENTRARQLIADVFNLTTPSIKPIVGPALLVRAAPPMTTALHGAIADAFAHSIAKSTGLITWKEEPWQA